MENRFQSLPFKCNLQCYNQVEVKTWFEAQGKIAARRDFAMTSVGNGGSVETPVVGLYKLESSGPIA